MCLRLAGLLLGGLVCLPTGLAHAAGCKASYTVPVALIGDVARRASDNSVEGYVPDLVAELARRSGCDLKIEEVPAARISAMRQHGEVAILAYSTQRPSAPGYAFIPTERFAHDLLVNTAHVASPPTVKSVLADSRLVFGRVRGMNYGPEIEALLAQLGPSRVDESSSIDDLYRKLVAGRVDAAFQFPLVYRGKLAALSAEHRVAVLPFDGAAPQVGGWAFHTPPMDGDDAERLATAVRMMRDDGTTTRILARFVGDAAARRARYAGAGQKAGKS